MRCKGKFHPLRPFVFSPEVRATARHRSTNCQTNTADHCIQSLYLSPYHRRGQPNITDLSSKKTCYHLYVLLWQCYASRKPAISPYNKHDHPVIDQPGAPWLLLSLLFCSSSQSLYQPYSSALSLGFPFHLFKSRSAFAVLSLNPADVSLNPEFFSRAVYRTASVS